MIGIGQPGSELRAGVISWSLLLLVVAGSAELRFTSDGGGIRRSGFGTKPLLQGNLLAILAYLLPHLIQLWTAFGIELNLVVISCYFK